MNNCLIPLFKRIKVKVDNVEKKTASGIIIPDKVAEKEKRRSGTIISTGDQVEALAIGDRILFGEYAGFTRYEDNNGNIDEKDGTRYQYMNESDAVAIFEKGE